MSATILADESVNGHIIKDLSQAGISIEGIMDLAPSISDREVIELATSSNQILITEDKDFGEWVFSHGINGLTIIFLRYEKADYELIIGCLTELLDESQLIKLNKENEFITINKNKIRRRKI